MWNLLALAVIVSLATPATADQARPVARAEASATAIPAMRPQPRPFYIPRTRWEHRGGHLLWTRAAMAAVAAHGLDDVTPRDIGAWCPAYAKNPQRLRRAFWVGMMSALAKHESTWEPAAVGGGGRWFGLLQISPATARFHGCRASSGRALQKPVANLACAARIMAKTVQRDRAVAVHDGRWRGVAADWGPMTRQAKRAEMMAWTRAQPYCKSLRSQRPQARPATLKVAAEAAALPGSD